MESCERNGVRWLRADLGGAIAAFAGRSGGVSPAPYDSLNLGLLTDDADSNAVENRRRLAAALGFEPERIAYGLQVHGAELATVPSGYRGAFGRPRAGREPAEGIARVDGQVLTGPGPAALVFTADCLPVALRGPGGAAMLHAGWRGLAAGILATGVEAVGATDAAIGPGIGPCCYEVGEEVLVAFAGLGPGVAEGRNLDLTAAAAEQLRAAGVERIATAGICTSCNPDQYFSHRRDSGATGRQGNVVWLAGEGS